MRRTPLVLGVLALAAACSGGGKRTGPAGGGKGSGSGSQAPPVDAELAARQAFTNPGGMWLPRQIGLPAHVANLEAMGVEIAAAKLTDPLAAPLGAVVSLDGCTGSFVSADGLLITNHHCVQTALQQSSTEEENLVEHGFLAKTRADEKSAGPAQRVLVMQASRDVTAEVTAGLADIADPGKRVLEEEDRIKKLVAGCEQDRPGIECAVEHFFRGAEYQLIESLELLDVRLVYAPHRAVGNYGGEIDNWAWPRHVGDFAFYRAYVGKDGKPAAFSPDNIPYQPAHWLKVSSRGLRAHDFVMVVGYPGSTQRLHTYSEVKHDIEFTYPYLIGYLQQIYDLLAGLAVKGGETGIKAGVFIQFVQNALENSQGVLAGLTGGDLLARKQALDEQVKAWAGEKGREASAAGIARLEEILAEERKTARGDFDLGIAMSSSMLGNAMLLVRMAEERPKKDADRKAGYQDRDLPQLEAGQQGFALQYDATIDRESFRLGLHRALALPAEERPWLATIIGGKTGATIDAKMLDRAVDKMYATSKLADTKLRLGLLRSGTTRKLRASKDPFIKLALALRPLTKALEERNEKLDGDRLLAAPHYGVAMREVLGGVLSPDANSTLRITYGTVKPFKPGEVPFTRASEIPAKDTGKEPFDAPHRVLDAIAAKNWGPYVDPVLGEVPVDFLSDLDITGGNSGSPTLDGHGELVGLAFDGTIEGVASDVVFDGKTTRTIHVDIRYALWVMDALDGADHVLEELGVTPAM